MNLPTTRLAFAFTAVLSAAAVAQDPPTRELDFQTGKVEVQGGVATIDLPDGWSYLQSRDARYVVEDVWGNPPDPSVHGLVLPPRFGEDDGPTWAIIVGFVREGYVSDEDAAGIDYDELLAGMKESSEDENALRRREGYPTLEILGWAEAPHYDTAQRKLYWAKALQFEGESVRTLNYQVRILGRYGFLEMNAVATVDELAEVAQGAKEILGATEFTSGNRYEEFDPGLDKVAAYGIGGLIAGKVLAKAGILKLLLKPLLVVGAIGAAAFARVFGRKRKAAPADAS